MNLTKESKGKFIRELEKHSIRIESIEPDVESINGFDVYIDRVCLAIKGKKLHEMKFEECLGGEIESCYSIAELEKLSKNKYMYHGSDNVIFNRSKYAVVGFINYLKDKKRVEEILNDT